MKWRSLFRPKKQREKVVDNDDEYSEISAVRPQQLYRSDSTPCFPQPGIGPNGPIMLPPYQSDTGTDTLTSNSGTLQYNKPIKVQISRSNTMHQTTNPYSTLSGKSSASGEVSCDYYTKSLPRRCHLQDDHSPTDISDNSANIVAFCPNCHTLVHPITKRRTRIKTNPWLSTRGKSQSELNAKANTPTSPTGITDSGISDHQLGNSDDTGSISGPQTIMGRGNFNAPGHQEDNSDQHDTIKTSNRNKSSNFDAYDDVDPYETIPATDESSCKQKRRKKKQRKKKSISDNSGMDMTNQDVQKFGKLLDDPNDHVYSTINREQKEKQRKQSACRDVMSQSMILTPTIDNTMSQSMTFGSRPLPQVQENRVYPSNAHSTMSLRRPTNMMHQSQSTILKASASDLFDHQQNINKAMLQSRIYHLRQEQLALEANFHRVQLDFQTSLQSQNMTTVPHELSSEKQRKFQLLQNLATAHQKLNDQMNYLQSSLQNLSLHDSQLQTLPQNDWPKLEDNTQLRHSNLHYHNYPYFQTYSTLPRHM